MFIVIGAVALLALYFRPASGQSLPPTVSQIATAQAQVLESAEQQRRAVAQVKLQCVLDIADGVLATVDRLAEEMEAWEREILPLLHNEDGRLIAADFDRAKSFSALLRVERPTPDHLDRQRARINTLVSPLRDAVGDERAAFKPDETIETQLERERKLAETYLTALRDSRKGVEALLVEARQQGDHPARETLEERVSGVEEHFASLRARELARVREVAEKEHR
ncbi:MAG: hypothetical protein KKB50_14860 [Planctomycetes bacterium]|nr:hypothetical protein [Planctomycetota bacterium]